MYKIGEIVFIKRPPTSTEDPTKLQSKYKRPLVITQVLPKDVYRVAAVRSQKGQFYETTVHVSNIKGYYLPVDTVNVFKNDNSVEDEDGVVG